MTTPSVTIGSLVRRYRYLLVVLALLVCGAVALLASSPPGLTWNQASPAPTVVAGGATSTTTISFTATGKLPNAVVQLSPSFAGLVSVSPTNLGTVIQGQTVTLTLTSSAPSSSMPAVVQGSVQIQKQQNPPLVVYGSPLQVNLNVTWPSVAMDGVSLTYPATWQLNQDTLTNTQVIQLTNFGNAYLGGGIIPSGGAQISLPSYLQSSTTIAQLIASDTAGDTVDSTQQVTVGGANATRVESEIQFGQYLSYKRIAYYIPHGQVIYKLMLDYNIDDPNEATLLSQLQSILSTLTFN